jgi:hypothetical protein
MTTTQRDAIASPATGLRIYNTTTLANNTYNGTAWLADVNLTAAGRLLLGTTTEGTFILDVNGTTRTGTLTVKGTSGNAKSFEVLNSFNGTSSLLVDQYGIISFTNGGTNTTAAFVGTLFSLGQNSNSPAIIWQANNNEISQYTTLGTRNSSSTSATVLVANNQLSPLGFTVAGNMDTGQQNDRILMNLRHWSGSGVLTFGSINQVQRYTLLDADIVVTPTVANKTLHGIRYRPAISGTALAFHYAATFASGQIGIGTETPNASSLLDITSTTQGFLPPRMTTTQKNAIGTPAQGLMVFDTTLVKLCAGVPIAFF